MLKASNDHGNKQVFACISKLSCKCELAQSTSSIRLALCRAVVEVLLGFFLVVSSFLLVSLVGTSVYK